MKKYFGLKILFVSMCVIVLCAGSVSAVTASGKVLDIFGDNIATIQIGGGHSFSSGDTVDLVYIAGMLPMLIGRYEVTTVNGDVVLCRPVSQAMPPSVGMNVEVELVRKASGSMKVKALNEPEMAAKNDLDVSGDAQVKRSFRDIAPFDRRIEIKGEVLDVMGEDVKVAIKDNGTPQAGWQVDLFYLTAQGKELPVGTWEVKSIDGQTLTASKVKGMGDARKGLKAVIHNGQKADLVENNVSPGPGGAGSVGELMTGPGVFKDVPANRPPPIELMGERYNENNAGENFGDGFFDPSRGPVTGHGPGAVKEATFDEYKKRLDDLQGNDQQMIAKQIEAFIEPRKYWLGVEVATNDTVLGQLVDSGPVGVRVIRVFPGSSAAKAKIEVADIIHEANGVEITDSQQFVDMVNNAPNGKLRLKIERNYKMMEKSVTLKEIK